MRSIGHDATAGRQKGYYRNDIVPSGVFSHLRMEALKMEAVGVLGHGVSLSPRLRQILSLAVSQADAANATLASADALLRRCSNEDLNDLLKALGNARRLNTGNGLTTDRSELNEEFFALRDHWGEGYQISPLLDAAEQGLRTHSRAEHVIVGEEFEIDGPAGDGEFGARKKWQRMTVGEWALINGKVAARCLGSARNTANLDLFEPGTVVRPHFMSNSSNAGRRFSTPDEHRMETEQWKRWKDASKRIEDRVSKTLIGLGNPKRVSCSVSPLIWSSASPSLCIWTTRA